MKEKQSSTGKLRRGGPKRKVPAITNGMITAEITYLEGEIEYLSQIKHERHEHMIQKRKQRVKELKEILNNEC